MPKKGGQKAKKMANKSKHGVSQSRVLRFAEESEVYGVVLQALGNDQLRVKCQDGIERDCHIPGSMQRKVWINPEDHVLVSIRNFQEKRGDITHKYMPDEVRKLKQSPSVKALLNVLGDKGADENAINFVFDEKKSDSKEEVDDEFFKNI